MSGTCGSQDGVSVAWFNGLEGHAPRGYGDDHGFLSVQGIPHIIAAMRLEMLKFQTDGPDTVFSCSVEEIEDEDRVKQKEEQEEKEDGEDYQESAKHIRVIETDFKRPLRSSFRAKKGGEKR